MWKRENVFKADFVNGYLNFSAVTLYLTGAKAKRSNSLGQL